MSEHEDVEQGVEDRFVIPTIIGTQLRFDLVDAHNVDAEIEAIDFEEVFNLLNYIESEPIEVLKTILKFKTGMDRIYLHYKDKYETLKLELVQYEAVQTDRFGRKDPSNPLFGTKTLTKDAIASTVRQQPEWEERSAELQVVNEYKSQMGLVKNVLADLFSIAKILVNFTISSRTNEEGGGLDTNEIYRLSKQFTGITNSNYSPDEDSGTDGDED